MMYCLSGILSVVKEGFVAVDVGGVSYKVALSARAVSELPPAGRLVRLYTHLSVREDALDLYGFLTESDLYFFEKLITVSGVGPKSALAVMAVAQTSELMAAVNEGKIDLLTRASGVGRKTAERIIVELRDRLPMVQSAETVQRMESDLDIEEALIGLGYSRQQAKKAVSQLDLGSADLEQRLKAALKLLKK